MPRYTPQDIAEVADALRNARGHDRPAHILFGAGCSRSAGIPLAREIVAEIHKRYPNYCKTLPETDRRSYGACMKKLAPNERRSLLSPYLRNARINWAHIAIAHLMQQGFIERALTVNFDNLLARACGLLSLYPAIYDFGSAPTSALALIVSPAIVHLHGQGHGVVLLNTEEETTAHATKIAPVIRESLADHPLLIIGYSGEADDVLQIIREHYSGREHLYWISFDEEPQDAVHQLLKGHDYIHHLGGADADLFLIGLAQSLESWPPAIYTDPVGHLLDELTPVADYPTIADNKIDILLEIRTRLAELRGHEQAQREASGKIGELILKGRYADAADTFENRLNSAQRTPQQNSLASAALVSQGVQLSEHARRTAEVAEADRLFRQAEAKYEEAFTINPNDKWVLNNWAATLAQHAVLTDDTAAADELSQQAEAKHEEVHKSDPHNYISLCNWGSTLANRARRTKDDARAVTLLQEAKAKYKKALRIKPDYAEAFDGLGATLMVLA